MSDQYLEPGEREEPPEQDPPEKLEFRAQAYGWMKHVHQEIDELAQLASQDYDPDADLMVRLNHVNDSFEEALRELALHVPEDKLEEVTERAAARRGSMVEHPLPPFPSEDAHRPGMR